MPRRQASEPASLARSADHTPMGFERRTVGRPQPRDPRTALRAGSRLEHPRQERAPRGSTPAYLGRNAWRIRSRGATHGFGQDHVLPDPRHADPGHSFRAFSSKGADVTTEPGVALAKDPLNVSQRGPGSG